MEGTLETQHRILQDHALQGEVQNFEQIEMQVRRRQYNNSKEETNEEEWK